jgi:hypothetical protein
MITVVKRCPNCKSKVVLPWKRRSRPGYCSTRCAYDHRTVNQIRKNCQSCKETFFGGESRKYCSLRCSAEGYKGFKHSERTKKLLRSLWPESRKASARIPTMKQRCTHCKKWFPVKIRGKGSVRVTCSVKCYFEILRTNNHMKRPEYRRRVSDFARNRPKELRKRIGAAISKAWRDGKFDGVGVGKCEWYEFSDRYGTTHKVQGKWELAFVEWMNRRRLKFVSHRGRFGYSRNGVQKNWYPDFYVPRWRAWVDVKCDHFYDPKKFVAVRRRNPELSVLVLRKKNLLRLGVLLP